MTLLSIEDTPAGLLLGAVLAYFVLIVLIRWSGFRTVSQMTIVGFIVAITAGEAVASALISPSISIFRGLSVAAVFIGLEMLLARLALYSPRLRHAVFGSPVPLVENGKVLEGNLHRHAINVDLLVQQLRQKQAFHLGDIETAVLEPNGQISVQLKADKAALQPSQLGLHVTPSAGLPRVVINDGTIRQHQLYALGFNETWLMQELAKRGYTNMQDIVVAQLDSGGNLYVDTVNDFRQTQPPQDKKQILAGLQKLRADLAAYSVETDDERMQAQYHADAERMAKVLEKVTPHLQS